MPYMSPEDRKVLLGPLAGVECRDCHEVKIRNYCRQCDEFFYMCGCGPSEDHEGHRIYLWTIGGVIAIPSGIGEQLDALRRLKVVK